MVNRRIDQLPAIAPDDPAVYVAKAQRLVMEGYLAPPTKPEREGTSRWRCTHDHRYASPWRDHHVARSATETDVW
jgi:hypothetical protein